MDENQIFEITFYTLDILWFIGCVIGLIVALKRKDRELFNDFWLPLFCTPIGAIPAMLLLFMGALAFVFGYIPDKIFKDK